jgi:hypothetical protein
MSPQTQAATVPATTLAPSYTGIDGAELFNSNLDLTMTGERNFKAKYLAVATARYFIS